MSRLEIRHSDIVSEEIYEFNLIRIFCKIPGYIIELLNNYISRFTLMQLFIHAIIPMLI